jgi:DNA-binding LacI/PurR family transcriptional regulator
MNTSGQAEPWRIATVWLDDWGQSPHMFHALHRWVDLTAAPMVLRNFSASGPDFQRHLVPVIKHWSPHGVVVRMTDRADLQCLRSELSGVPFVATLHTAPDLVDTCVVTDIAEALSLAVDHLRKQGAHGLAFYYSGAGHAAERHLAAFRSVAPDGLTLVYPHEDQTKRFARRVQGPGHEYKLVYPEEKRAAGAEHVRQWLQALPKPAGVVTLEIGAAGFLLEQCRRLGLRVPDDVQLIGADDTNICLGFEPHLTSVALPRARIGELAMETMLRHLCGERPSSLIEVSGSALVARGSTGLVHIGASAVDATLKLMETEKARGATATKMARLSGVGRTTLYRQFLAATGEPPARHLRKMRIQEACRMLRESSDSITAIAQACGFSSLFSFTRSFRRETGQSPTQYRKSEGGE